MPICVFLDWNLKKTTIVLFEISTVEFVNMQKFVQSKIISNLEPKMPYLGVFLGCNFEKTDSIFQNGFLELVKLQSFVQK